MGQVLERLYRLQWGKLDGLGALVISPTRELAMQIFEELKKIGKPHDFSAGLLIGGKNVREEQSRVNGMSNNVVLIQIAISPLCQSPSMKAMTILG